MGGGARDRPAFAERLRSGTQAGSVRSGHRLCGQGHFDRQAHLDYHAGKLQDYEYPEEEIAMALAGLPTVEQISTSHESHEKGARGRPFPWSRVQFLMKPA